MATLATLLKTIRKLSSKETSSDHLLPRRRIALRLWSLLLFSCLTVSKIHAQTSSHLDFVYADRNALLADGWSFVAKSATGTARDTEQTGPAAVNYSQTSHPGMIRIPIGGGELWQAVNNSKNMLFRPLPSDWSSIRLKIAAFTPDTDYQQVALLAYQDDDNYLNVQRNFNNTAGGAVIGFFKEEGGVATRTDRR